MEAFNADLPAACGRGARVCVRVRARAIWPGHTLEQLRDTRAGPVAACGGERGFVFVFVLPHVPFEIQLSHRGP